jgi:hypothetical protein
MACTKNSFTDILVLPDSPDGKKRGKIVIKAETASESNNDITIECEANLYASFKGWCRGEDKPYLQIERARNTPSELKEGLTHEHCNLDCTDFDMIPVAHTPHIDEDLNPKFEKIKKKM